MAQNQSLRTTEDKTRVFVLQDTNGFHVVLRKSLAKKAKTLEKDKEKPRFTRNDKEMLSSVRSRSTGLKLNSEMCPLASCPLKSKSLSAAKLINCYLYIGTLHISEKNVLAILEIALRLGLTAVQEACMMLLSRSLTIGNWNEAFRLAKEYHNRTLKTALTKFISQHFSKCFSRKDSITLTGSLTRSKIDLQSLKFLLRRCQAGTKKKNMIKAMADVLSSEAKMWEYCFKEYLQHTTAVQYRHEDDMEKGTTITGKTSQGQTAETFLDNSLPIKEAAKTANNALPLKKTASNAHRIKEPAKRANTALLLKESKSTANNAHLIKEPAKLANNALLLKESKKIANNAPPSSKLTRNNILNYQPTSTEYTGIMIAGGISDSQNPKPIDSTHFYIPTRDLWLRVPAMKRPRYNHSLVSIGDTVFAIGGNTTSRDNAVIEEKRDISVSDTMFKSSLLNQTQTNSVEQFSIKCNQWTETCSMILSREEHCCVVIGNQIYSIGGHDGVSQLCSVEKYNCTIDQWTLEKPMSTLHTGASAVTDGRYIYVIGGYDGITWLDNVECYDTLTKTWARCKYPPMAERRGYAGVEILKDDIFVFGGTNDCENLKTCEVFNLRIKEWRKGPSMSRPRLNAAHCVVDGRILVMGGESNGEFLDTIEQLDTNDWEWRNLCKMPIKVAGMQCCVVAAKLQ